MNSGIIEYLYRHHYKYLFMVAYNLCRRWDMAEDIVQDGFIKIIHTNPALQDWRHGRKYLTGCIKNAAFERLGKEARIRAMKRDALTSESDLPASIAIDVLASVSKLKLMMSQVIIREIYFHNRSRKEIAEIYQVDRKTIRKQELAALSELEKLIPAYQIKTI